MFFLNRVSIIDSSSGRRLIDKWQLLKKHHCPDSAALLRISVAFWLCPLPKDNVERVCPFSAANLLRRSVGSTPDVRTNMIGRVGVESSNISLRLVGLF